MKATQYQLKIAEHVSVSVTAMANSVPTIISESLNDRINTIEAENKRLSGQVIQITEKVNALEMNNEDEELTCHRADLLRSARQLVKNKSLKSL